MKRKHVCGVISLGLSLLLFCSGLALAAPGDYPEKPITFHIGYPPGAWTGNVARIFADGFQKYLPKSQPVLVNFKPGASAAIATDFVLKQPADGYNLMWHSIDIFDKLAKDGHLLSFTKEDFAYIGTMGYVPCFVMVNKNSSFTKFEEFIEYAKNNPGKLSHGHTGVGGGSHLNGEIFQARCGIKLKQVPFSGGAPAIAALLGGHVDAFLGSSAAAGAHLKEGGGLRPLVVFSHERWPELPEVPTCLEKGYNVVRRTWGALIGHKGTPQPILDVLGKAFKRACDDPEVQESIMKQGFKPIYWGPEETAKTAKEEFEIAREVFKKLGLAQ